MRNGQDLVEWQRDQYEHDMRYHFDVLSLHKNDRLKHYALHFAKYTGRVARGEREHKSITQTVVDALLVSLSTANTLHQKLVYEQRSESKTLLVALADASGRICDSAEKIDHQEPFLDAARAANQDIAVILINWALSERVDIPDLLSSRRQELKRRQFFVR